MTKHTKAREGLAALSITTFAVLVLAGSAAFAQVAPVKMEHGLLQGAVERTHDLSRHSLCGAADRTSPVARTRVCGQMGRRPRGH
jgi:hypothetical protein